MMLSGNERRVVIDRAREEVHQLHLVDPDRTPGANLVQVSTAEPDWVGLERYRSVS